MKQYVAFSGGKDSTAMLLRMIELEEQIDGIFFVDTGEEWEILHEYISSIEKLIKRKITIIPPKISLWDWMDHIVTRDEHKGEYRGYPLAHIGCGFMRDVKIAGINSMADKDSIICMGFAYGEKGKDGRPRGQKIFEEGKIRRPLMEWGWSEERCVKWLNEKKLMNALYTNFNRIGCIGCPKQGIASLYVIWKNHPDKWEYIRKFNTKQNKLRNEDILFVDGYFSDIETLFESGYIPKKRPKYACYDCKGVTAVFTDQVSLCDFQD